MVDYVFYIYMIDLAVNNIRSMFTSLGVICKHIECIYCYIVDGSALGSINFGVTESKNFISVYPRGLEPFYIVSLTLLYKTLSILLEHMVTSTYKRRKKY